MPLMSGALLYHTVFRGPTAVGREASAVFDSASSVQYNRRSVIAMHAGRGAWRWIIGGLCCGIVLIGCGGARSLLRPLPEAPSTVDVGAGVRVTVDAITASTELGATGLTSPGFTPDDVELLARFYTVLWVEVRNEGSLVVTVAPERAIVFDRTGTPWIALDRTQRVRTLRWRPWSWEAWLAGWVSAGRIARLTAKLDRLQLESGSLAAGEMRRGVLVFKRIPAPVCRQATLEWKAARAESDPASSSTMSMVQLALGC